MYLQYYSTKWRNTSMRTPDYGQNLVRSKSKTKSFFIYSFMIIALLAVGGGIYYAIFTPKYLNTDATTPQAPPPEQDIAPADTIADILTGESTQNNTATAQRTQARTDENRDNLPVSDMQEMQATQGTQEAQDQTNSFELTPPANNSQKDFTIPDNDELEEKRRQSQINKLAMLQQAKTRQLQLAEQETRILPGTQGRLISSERSLENTSQDPVITDLFVQNLAELLVDNYNPSDSRLNAIKISQHFGITMEGLVHPKNRQGIFEYAYQPEMIRALANFMAPRLISEMDYVADVKGFNEIQKQRFFHEYAKKGTNTALMLTAIVNTKNLDKHIYAFLKTEQKLSAKKKEFARTLIEFETAKQDKQNTKKFERQLGKISREANVIEKSLITSRKSMLSSILKTDPTLSGKSDLLDLAFWVNRRNNKEATLAAIQALRNFSSLLSTK